MCENNECQTDEAVLAVRNKVNRMIDNALMTLEEKASKRVIDVQAEASTITEKLFKNMTKQDIVEGILDDDTLSFKNLLARDDVQKALDQTQKLYMSTLENSMDIGNRLSAAELQITEMAEVILEDVIIFGVTSKLRSQLMTLESKLDAILATI